MEERRALEGSLRVLAIHQNPEALCFYSRIEGFKNQWMSQDCGTGKNATARAEQQQQLRGQNNNNNNCAGRTRVTLPGLSVHACARMSTQITALSPSTYTLRSFQVLHLYATFIFIMLCTFYKLTSLSISSPGDKYRLVFWDQSKVLSIMRTKIILPTLPPPPLPLLLILPTFHWDAHWHHFIISFLIHCQNNSSIHPPFGEASIRERVRIEKKIRFSLLSTPDFPLNAGSRD